MCAAQTLRIREAEYVPGRARYLLKYQMDSGSSSVCAGTIGQEENYRTWEEWRLKSMSTLAIVGLTVWVLISGTVDAALVAGSRADDRWGYDNF